MLFTRCPGCQTTFRITADALRVADGAVRCGHCATVFSAYSGLRQEAPGEAPEPDDETLSPTLQTREMAAIEEIESPAVDAGETAAPDAAASGSPHGDRDAGTDDSETAPCAPGGEADDARAAGPPSAERLAALGAPAPTDTVTEPEPAASTDAPDPAGDRHPAQTDSGEQTSPESAEAPGDESGRAEPESLTFDAPADEWDALLGELERGDAGGPASLGAEHADAEPWDVGDPMPAGAPDAQDDTESAPRPADAEAASAGPVLEASGEPGAARDGADAGDAAESVISAEEIDATLSNEPDPDIIAVLEGGLGQPERRAGRSKWWGIGAAALLVVLGLQLAHHFRAPLAAQPVIGPLLRSSYAALGIDLTPEWDLAQYEIADWSATAGPNGAGTGSLHITAQIRNAGPRAQPYPSVRLELKDRWEAVIGRRVFEPEEYMPDAERSGLMAAGATVPADLTVVDPGLDASGFELDVCLSTETGGTSCASDRIFEQ